MLIKMLEIIIKIVSLLFVLLGIILIYDARIVTKRFFSFGDQNDATQRIKDNRIYFSNDWWVNLMFYFIN